MKVPYLSKMSIENSALHVLGKYQNLIAKDITAPIPVEDIIETYMHYDIGFVAFETITGMENILGALFMDRKLVVANKSLDQERYRPRLAFTLAHEVGHFDLHAGLMDSANRSGAAEERIYCREGDSKNALEWQADYFASALLMPGKMVQAAFQTIFQAACLDIHQVERSFPYKPSIYYFENCVDNWQFIAQAVIDEGGFQNVSKQAMFFRLQEMGLLKNRTQVPMGHYKKFR